MNLFFTFSAKNIFVTNVCFIFYDSTKLRKSSKSTELKKLVQKIFPFHLENIVMVKTKVFSFQEQIYANIYHALDPKHQPITSANLSLTGKIHF